MHFVIVTGLSGAGKSIAIKSFEDIGFYCVDNLPATLIPMFADLIVQSKVDRVALGIDVRERDFFTGLFAALDRLENQGHELEILFLEAKEEVLVVWLPLPPPPSLTSKISSSTTITSTRSRCTTIRS